MSPLAEKLVAILEDRDKLAALLAESRNECAAKEDAIIALQQQSAKQSSDISIMKKQVSSLQTQVATALLLATDPDDAKVKSRIDAVYTTISPKGAGSAPANPAPAPKSAATASTADIAASLSSVARPPEVSVSVPRNGTPRSGSSGPARPATPPVPAGQTLSAQEVAYRFVD
jgi:hypothetical protein